MARVTLNGKRYILRKGSRIGWSYVQTFEDVIRQRSGVLSRQDNQVGSRLRYGWQNGVGWGRQDRENGRGEFGLRSSTWNTLHRIASFGILNESQTHAAPAEHIVKYMHFKSDLWGIFEEDYDAAEQTEAVVRKFNASTDTWDAPTAYTPTADANNSAIASSASSVSAAVTIASQSDRLAVATVAWQGAPSISSVTAGGVAMTNIVTNTNDSDVKLAVYYIFNPGTGSVTFTATLDGTATNVSIHASSYYDVPPSSVVRGSSSSHNASAASMALSLTARNTDLVVGGFVYRDASGGHGTVSFGTSQTSFGEQNDGALWESTGSYEVATAASTAFDHSYSVDSGNAKMTIAAAVFAGGSGEIQQVNANATGMRVFDAVTHKGKLWVVGSGGFEDEAAYYAYHSDDGSNFLSSAISATDYMTTTVTRRNNFDDDQARLCDFGNTLLAAVYEDPDSTGGSSSQVRVFYTTNGGTSWTAGAVIPTGSGPKAFVRWKDPFSSPVGDSPVLVLAEGVYRVDAGGTTYDRIWAMDGNSANGRFADVGLDGDLYVGFGTGKVVALHAFEGGVEHRFPGPPGDGFVAAEQGHVNYVLVPPEPWIVVSYGGHAAGKNAGIWAIEYTRKTDPSTGKQYQPWHMLYKESDANIDCHVVGFSTEDNTTPRLHFGLENATSDEMFHLEEPFTDPTSGVTQKFQLTSTMQFAEDDMGDPLTTGTMHEARVEVDNLSADTSGEYLDYKYGVDGAAWDATDLGDFLSGNKDLVFGTGAGVAGKTLRNTLVGTRDAGDNTDTALLKDFEVMATKKQQLLRQCVLEIDLNASAKEATDAVNMTPEEVLTNLETVMKSGTKVAFTLGQLGTMYVRIRQPAMWSLEPLELGGGDGESAGTLHGIATIILEEVLEGSPTS